MALPHGRAGHGRTGRRARAGPRTSAGRAADSATPRSTARGSRREPRAAAGSAGSPGPSAACGPGLAPAGCPGPGPSAAAVGGAAPPPGRRPEAPARRRVGSTSRPSAMAHSSTPANLVLARQNGGTVGLRLLCGFPAWGGPPAPASLPTGERNHACRTGRIEPAPGNSGRIVRRELFSAASSPFRVPRGGPSHEVAKRAYIRARCGHQVPTGSGPPLQAPAEYPGRLIHM